MNKPLPSYLDQSDAVRARFDRMKAREVILQVEHLSKRFTASGGTTLALDDINFVTHRREFLCIVGPSGCGKSTLARIIAGLKPDAGVLADDGRALLEARQYGPAKELLAAAAATGPSAGVDVDLAIATFHALGQTASAAAEA